MTVLEFRELVLRLKQTPMTPEDHGLLYELTKSVATYGIVSPVDEETVGTLAKKYLETDDAKG